MNGACHAFMVSTEAYLLDVADTLTSSNFRPICWNCAVRMCEGVGSNTLQFGDDDADDGVDAL